MSLSLSNRRRQQGFTLVELLVVIAVISVLAAILFPAFASAREKARQITCLSNTRQIGMAVMQYGQDYDDIIVPWAMEDANPANNDPNTATQRIWVGLLQPYIKNGQNTSTLNNVASRDSSGVFHCPSFSIKKLAQAADAADCDSSDGSGNPGTGGVGPVNFSFADYGISIPWGPNNGTLNPTNLYNNFAGSGFNLNGDWVNQSLNQIQRPSETALIGDGWTGYAQGQTSFQIYFGCEAASMHQNAGGNFVFLDGHAKYIQGSIFHYTTNDSSGQPYMTYLTYDK